MKVKKTNFMAMCCDGFFIIVALLLATFEFDFWVKCSFYLYTFAVVVNLCCLYRIKKSLKSFAIICYVLSSLFHISQIYFGYIGYSSRYCVFSRLSLQSCQYGLTYAFICIHIAYFVYFLLCKSVCRNININDYKGENVDKIDEFLVRVFFYFLFSLKVVIRIYLFYVSYTRGYIALLASMNALTSTIVMATDVFSIVFLKEICGYKERKIWVAIIGFTEIAFMLSGSRIQGITYILLLLLFIDTSKATNRKKRLNKLQYIIIAIFLVILLPLISGSRFSEKGTVGFIGSGNLLQSIIEEFGMTILNTVVAIQNKSQINFLHGLSYYGGLAYIFPNIGDIFNKIENSIYYTNQLKTYFTYTYGGSNIAESYMNFGYYGCIIFVFVGVAIAKIDEITEKITQKNVAYQLFAIMLVYQFILWTRSYFYQMIRLPIWMMFFYWIAKQLAKRRSK